ncbi:helix-turn-helix transcriptional regulator [Geofilum rubicundum]|nr:WYL domain-containing transcriptional regulator [Geofilum rubicundum]
MPDQPKLSSLLEIIMLLSSGIKYSINQISDRLDLTPRTTQRYLKTIRDAGFIIPRPVNGLYFIDKQSPYFKELSELVHFSREEAQILYNAIHAISNENTIKQNLIQKLFALYKSPVVANILVKQQHSNNIHQLIKAIEQRRKVVLHNYQSANSSKQSNRLVEPYKFTTNYVSIWAYDLESGQNKIFKNSRIASVEMLNELWEHPDSHQEAEMDHFRMSTEERIPVRLSLTLRACELLKEEFPLAEGHIKEVAPSQYEYQATVFSLEGVGRFVLGLCDEVTIHEPEALKLFIQKKMNSFLK